MAIVPPLRRLIDGLSQRFPHIRVLGMISSSNMLAHLLQLASIPIVSRLYDGASIGRLAVYYLLSQVIAIAVSGRLEQGLFIIRSKRRSGYVALLLFCTIALFIVVGVALVSLFFLASGQAKIHLGSLALDQFEFSLFISQIGANSGTNVARAWAIRNGHYKGFSRATIGKTLLYIAVRIGGGVAGLGFLGLIVTEMVGALAMVGGLMLAMRADIPRWGVGRGVVLAKQWIRTLWRFPVFEMPSAFLDSFAQAIPALFVSNYYGFLSAGQYYMAYQILSVPVAQIGAPISDLFQNEIAKLQRQEQLAALTLVFRRYSHFLLAIGAMMYLTALVGSPWAFPLVLGSKWALAGLVGSTLSIWLFSAFVVGSLSRIFSVFSRQHVKFYYDLVCLGSMAIGVAIIFFGHLGFLVGVAIFSFANLLCYLWYYLVIKDLVRQLTA